MVETNGSKPLPGSPPGRTAGPPKCTRRYGVWRATILLQLLQLPLPPHENPQVTVILMSSDLLWSGLRKGVSRTRPPREPNNDRVPQGNRLLHATQAGLVVGIARAGIGDALLELRIGAGLDEAEVVDVAGGGAFDARARRGRRGGSGGRSPSARLAHRPSRPPDLDADQVAGVTTQRTQPPTVGT